MKSLYRWIYSEPDPGITAHLSNVLDLPMPLSKSLVNRGITDQQHALSFFNPTIDDLHSPDSFRDIEPAVDRVLKAVKNNERILIAGDYDVDGITGTALLVSFLESQGGHVRYYIPERDTEGYGLSEKVIRKAGKAGYDLIITVDTGISFLEEAALINDMGIDLIITDHHEPHDEIPDAVAVLNPKRADSQYPYRELAGVGVAFKLVTAVGERIGISLEKLLERYGEFVALGTISDMVPLLDENRFFANYGLAKMSKSRNIGLYSLIEVSNIRDGETLDTHHISFGLAPRINAAGRVWSARAGVELLLSKSPERARLIARKLDAKNRRRMLQEAKIMRGAEKALSETGMDDETRSVVLFDEDWQIGILGVVASKIMEVHHRPVILTTVSRNPDEMKKKDPVKGRILQGSARSVKGFDLYQALQECSDILISYGGHALAAGLKIYEADLPELSSRLNSIILEKTGEMLDKPELRIDDDISLAGASQELVRQSRRMNPFGVGNPQPLFSTGDVTVLQCRGVGVDGKHLQVKVGQASRVIDCIGFGMCNFWSPEEIAGEMIDIAYYLQEDNYGGRTRVKAHLKDMRVSKP
ncbi:MAG TPA: single-stranded-DNA-specific exonuclease RecJ [bacterium]|nr:single-stranded-DNA-specific exonuclease RecJ [bacterium]